MSSIMNGWLNARIRIKIFSTIMRKCNSYVIFMQFFDTGNLKCLLTEVANRNGVKRELYIEGEVLTILEINPG